MRSKLAKQIRKTARESHTEALGEIRAQFQQDFKFFRETVMGWGFWERLWFCRDLMLKRI